MAAPQRWLGLVAACCLLATPAAAQGIDYGALEALFGESITVSATGSPQRASDVPTDMEIVTADQIRQSGATNLPDVLAHVVGVDVLRWGVSSADVSIRGYDAPDSPRLLVLLNGREVYLDNYGRTQWDAIPVQLAEIRQIEIVKGPNTALFGFNAAAGVINIITYDPLYDTVRAASIGGGTQDFLLGSAVGTAKLGDWGGVRLSAGGFRSDEFAAVRQLVEPLGLQQRSQQGTAAADLHVRIGADQEAELEVTHASLNHVEVIPTWQPAVDDYDINSVRGSYSANTGVGLLQVTAYTNIVRQSGGVSGGALGEQTATINNQKTFVQLQDVFKLGAVNTFRVATEYQRNTMNTVPTAGAQIGYQVYSASGMWQWQILPELALTNAARIDMLQLERSGLPPLIPALANAPWHRHIDEPSFNTGLVYRPGDNDTLRLTAARGVQLPSLVELGGLQLALPHLIATGVPTVQPTVVYNYEFDWDHTIRPLNTTTRTALFYQVSDGLQAVQSGKYLILPTGIVLLTPANIGDSQEIGLELSARGTLTGGWRWNAGYSPRLVRDQLLPGQPPVLTGVDFARTTPHNVIDFGAGRTSGRWEIDAAARFESNFIGFNGLPNNTYVPVQVAAYLTLDARAAYQLTHNLTLALIGQGITYSSQRQTSVGSVDRRVIGVLQARF